MLVLCRVCHVCSRLLCPYWFVSCPCSCHYELSMFQRVVLLCVNYPVYISPVFEFDFVWSTRYFQCILSLSPALSCLDVIKYYYLSLRPRLRVLVPPSCVHRDRRPDPNSKWRPFTSFCFRF